MKIVKTITDAIYNILLNKPTKINQIGSTMVLAMIFSTIPSPVKAITLVTERTALAANDLVNWSSLGTVFNPFAPPNPNSFLSNSFTINSQAGFNVDVNVPFQNNVTPPFVFQTLPIPNGIPTNFGNGDFILLTGLTPGIFPSPGNEGPLTKSKQARGCGVNLIHALVSPVPSFDGGVPSTLNFEQPVFGAGTQIAVDDTLEFVAFISAFDIKDNLLGKLALDGTSSLELDNSAIFLGISSDKANIAKLVYSSSVSNRALGINQLSLVTKVTYL